MGEGGSTMVRAEQLGQVITFLPHATGADGATRMRLEFHLGRIEKTLTSQENIQGPTQASTWGEVAANGLHRRSTPPGTR